MTFPMMASAFWGWTESVQFILVTNEVVDFQAKETPVSQTPFDGVIEPLTPRLLMMKSEGERKFKYWTLWTDFELKLGAVIKDEGGSTYRVVKKSDWRSGDYQEYEIIETPTPPYAGD